MGAFLFPICSTVCKLVTEGRRKTTHNMLTVADLAKLPVSKLTQIREWLVHYLGLKVMDRFMLSPDQTRLQPTVACETSMRMAFLDDLSPEPQQQVWSSLSTCTSARELLVASVQHGLVLDSSPCLHASEEPAHIALLPCCLCPMRDSAPVAPSLSPAFSVS